MSLVDTSRSGDVRFTAMERLAATLERKGRSAASLFRRLDLDKSGALSWMEFVHALRELNCGLTETEELEICQLVDEDKNGTILYNEFVHALGLKGGYATMNNTYKPSVLDADQAKRLGLGQGAEDSIIDEIAKKVFFKSKTIAKVFRSFDKDGNGLLSIKEIEKGLCDLGVSLEPGDLDKLSEYFDPNGTGSIYYRDFAFRLGSSSSGGDQAGFKPIVPEDVHKYRFTVTHGKHSLLGQIAQSVELRSTNVRKVFRQLDRDGSGTLDMHELRIGLRHLGFDLDDAQFEQIWHLVDVDGDGQVTLQEFQSRITATMEQGNYTFEPSKQTPEMRMKYGLTMLRKSDLLWKVASKVEAKRKHLTQVFRSFDVDGDGEISYSEFRAGLAKLEVHLTDDEFYELIRKIDTDGDGFITYKEFAITMGSSQNSAATNDTEMSDRDSARKTFDLIESQKAAKERIKSGTVLESFPKGHVVHAIASSLKAKGRSFRRICSVHDADGDGKLTLQELRFAVRDAGIDLPNDFLTELFLRFGGDQGDGLMPYSVLADLLQPSGANSTAAAEASISRPLSSTTTPRATRTSEFTTPGFETNPSVGRLLTTPGRAKARESDEYGDAYLLAAGTDPSCAFATPGLPAPQVACPLPPTLADMDVDEGRSTMQTKCDVLWKVCMHVTSRKLSTSHVLRVLRRFDHDKDGHLSTDQVQCAISELGLQLSTAETTSFVRRFSPEVVHFVRLVDFRRLAAAMTQN